MAKGIFFILGGVFAISFSGFFFKGTWKNLKNLFSGAVNLELDAQTIRFVDALSRGALYGAGIYSIHCLAQAMENFGEMNLVQQYLGHSLHGPFYGILFYLFLKTAQQRLLIKTPKACRSSADQDSGVIGYVLAGLFAILFLLYWVLFFLNG